MSESEFKQGKITLTDVAVVFVAGAALVAFLKSRVKNVKLPDGDGITDSMNKSSFWSGADGITRVEIERLTQRIREHEIPVRNLPVLVKFYGIEQAENPDESSPENG